MQDGNGTWDFSRCVSVLREEIGLLKRAGLAQEEACRMAAARDWSGLGRRQREIDRLSREVEALDAGRADLFEALGRRNGASGGDLSFYDLTAELPESERLELGRLYRELKLETARIKTAHESFAGYLGEMKHITAAFLTAAFPARGGRLYSRQGAMAPQDMRSMVLNRSV